jgi:hypothetical protein
VTTFAAVDAARAFVNKIPDGVPVEELESWRVAVATMPFKILLVLRPSRMQVCAPGPALQVTDFAAAVACGPAVTTAWVTLAVG